MTNAYPGTQSVVRVIRLLKLFGGEQDEWTLPDLAAAAGLNKSTAFRMLTALEHEGMLERSETGSYRLGVEMAALGSRALQNNNLGQLARPYLESLAEETRERVTLELLVTNTDGDYSMLILEAFQSRYLINIQQEVGVRLPLHATSTGKVMLAFMPDEEREIALHNSLHAITPQTIINPTDLEAHLNTIRERGYATAIGELEAGLMATGAPIFNHLAEPVAAISLESIESRVDEAKLHQLAINVVDTAQQISARLGYRQA
ncbi:MAG: IclR family transcriptional regulator [Chloroflexota bacterium]